MGMGFGSIQCFSLQHFTRSMPPGDGFGFDWGFGFSPIEGFSLEVVTNLWWSVSLCVYCLKKKYLKWKIWVCESVPFIFCIFFCFCRYFAWLFCFCRCFAQLFLLLPVLCFAQLFCRCFAPFFNRTDDRIHVSELYCSRIGFRPIRIGNRPLRMRISFSLVYRPISNSTLQFSGTYRLLWKKRSHTLIFTLSNSTSLRVKLKKQN